MKSLSKKAFRDPLPELHFFHLANPFYVYLISRNLRVFPPHIQREPITLFLDHPPVFWSSRRYTRALTRHIFLGFTFSSTSFAEFRLQPVYHSRSVLY